MFHTKQTRLVQFKDFIAKALISLVVTAIFTLLLFI